MSEFVCPVVQIPWVKPVPNSDALEHTEVFETNVFCARASSRPVTLLFTFRWIPWFL
jgi:hypothetical protein